MEFNTPRLERIARAEATAHARYGVSARFGPLVAVYAGPGLPLNTAWHDGTHLPTPVELADFEVFSAQHGQRPTLHLLSQAAPELLPTLRLRDYTLDYVLHLYVHDLQNLPLTPVLDAQEPTDPAEWAALSTQGFGPGSEETMKLVARAPETHLFSVKVSGEFAGTAAMSVQDGIAAFFGTSTLAGARGRGVQAALLAYRLHAAAQAGADLATVFVTPGTGSERNIERAGFKLSGLRLTFTKDE